MSWQGPGHGTSRLAGRRDTAFRGGFEPFGADFSGASTAGVPLRLPGQWTDASWEQSSLGAEVYYNVHRWYEAGTGRYAEVDPLPFKPAPLAYTYSASRPIFYTDWFGLAPVHNGSPRPIPIRPEHGEQFELCLPGEDCDADGFYPPTCDDFPIKIVSGCQGEIRGDGKLYTSCPLFNLDAPGLRRKLPGLGQRAIGGKTDSDFHKRHPDWPIPNRKPFCGCQLPPQPRVPPVTPGAPSQ